MNSNETNPKSTETEAVVEAVEVTPEVVVNEPVVEPKAEPKPAPKAKPAPVEKPKPEVVVEVEQLTLAQRKAKLAEAMKEHQAFMESLAMEFKSLELMADSLVVDSRYTPRVGGSYYYIEPNGNIASNTNNNMPMDKAILMYSPVFANSTHAEWHKGRLAETQSLTNAIKRLNGNWFPDWNNANEKKFYVAYDLKTQHLVVHSTTVEKILPNSRYFSSEAIAQKAIETLSMSLIVTLSE